MYPAIEDQDAEQLAETFLQVVSRLGQLGREGREAIAAKLDDNENDPDVGEGMAQLQDVLDPND